MSWCSALFAAATENSWDCPAVRQERLCQWGKKEKTNCRSMTFQRDAVTCLVGLRVSIDLV